MTIAGRRGVVDELHGPGPGKACRPHRRLITASVLHPPAAPAAVTWYWAGQLPDMLTQVKGPVVGLERPVAAEGPASSRA
jgi:hypothetical protein